MQISSKELEELWKKKGTLRTVELTPNNLEVQCTNFLKRGFFDMTVYKPYSKTVGKSKGIKPVVEERTSYKEIAPQLKGLNLIYKNTRTNSIVINGAIQDVVTFTFLAYEKRSLRLSKSIKNKKYKKLGGNKNEL